MKRSGVLGKLTKKSKIAKIKVDSASNWVLRGRAGDYMEGCGLIRELRLRVFNKESYLRWYFDL